MFTLVLLSTLWIFFKGFHFIYFFQIKEYRFDRLFSALREQGILSIFYSLPFKRPALSLRNILIIGFHFLVVSVIFLYAFEDNTVYQTLSYTFPFAPFISFGIIATGVMVTSIPAAISRTILIVRAKLKVHQSNTVFIGITGSYGKTSVKEYLSHILSKRYTVGKTDENMNTDVGVAVSLLRNLKKDTRYFIAEFGAYRRGEIQKASSYIPLQYAILTGLGNQHLDLYGSREALVVEESSLLYQIPPEGTVYINADVPNRKKLEGDLSCKTVHYRLHEKTDIYGTNIRGQNDRMRMTVHYNRQVIPIETQLLGVHSLLNLLPCMALALDLGMTPTEIQSAIRSIEPIPGKLSVHSGYGKATVIHDGVNSNLHGFIAAIDTLQNFSQKNKILITQGIIELGGEKRQSYDQILQKLNNTHIKLFTTDPLFTTIKESEHIITFNDVGELHKTLLSRMNKGTVVLIEGTFPQNVIRGLIHA